MIVCDFSGESCEEEQPNQVQLVRHILSEVHHVVQGEPPSLSFACATLRYLDSSYHSSSSGTQSLTRSVTTVCLKKLDGA